MRTRSQVYSETVYKHIQSLQQTIENEKNEKRKEDNRKTAKQYGSLCHSFPLMVLRNGLSQAVAFVWVKANQNEASAHAKFLKHLSKLTGAENETPEAFQRRINTLELTEYQRTTRKILAASIWYKRFAESILGVKSGQEDTDSQEKDHA